MITVATPANTTALTTRERVKRLMGKEDTADDLLLDELVVAATAAVEAYCHRTFARETLVETVRGYGGTVLMLGRAPIVLVTSVLGDGTDPITDWVYDSKDAGLLYRKRGWQDTVQLGWAITGYSVPGSEDPLYAVAYSAGFLLAGDNVEVESGLSVDAPSRQFRRATGSFPLTLVGGDRVFADDFGDPANNGWFTVQAVAPQAVTVAETTLVTEGAGEGVRSLKVETLPADVELAARETARAMYLARKRDDVVASKTIGALSITYRDTPTTAEGVPTACLARLAPWRRMA